MMEVVENIVKEKKNSVSLAVGVYIMDIILQNESS